MKGPHMKKLGPKGFSIVEVLIFFVVFTLIGGVGWLIYSRQSNPKTEDNTQTAEVSSELEKANEVENSYEGWKTYISPTGDISFKYPSLDSLSWKTIVNHEILPITSASVWDTYRSIEAEQLKNGPESGPAGIVSFRKGSLKDVASHLDSDSTRAKQSIKIKGVEGILYTTVQPNASGTSIVYKSYFLERPKYGDVLEMTITTNQTSRVFEDAYVGIFETLTLN
jgi:hypothetical protein